MSRNFTVGPSETFEYGDQGSRPRKFEQLIGNSSALETVLDGVKRVAPTSSTVLIQG
jgi:transcriptional regulator with GAF, ATPase, and Fis domain